MTKIFISHASEDKNEIARPLADALRNDGFEVWFDEYSLTLGDSLEESIAYGITSCDFGVVIVSSLFLQKPWTKSELDALFNKQLGMGKVILPIWHNVKREDVLAKAPLLVGRLAASSNEGIESLVKKIQVATKNTYKNERYKRDKEDNLRIIISKSFGGELYPFILEAFSKDYKIDINDIDGATIANYEDYSGMDDYESFFLLKDGTKIPFDENYILKATSYSHPILTKSYSPVEWDFIGHHNLPGDRIPFKELEIALMFIEGKFEFLPEEADRIRTLKSVIQADVDFVNFGMSTWRFEDGIFNGPTVCDQILRKLIADERVQKIEELIFDRNTKERFSFIISKMFIENVLENINTISNRSSSVRLMNKIAGKLNNRPILNDYWIDKISKFMSEFNDGDGKDNASIQPTANASAD